ncbi:MULTISPECIES: type I restriction-modification system subunit M N-terminal domain-containing protein [Methylobacter]
MSNHEIVQKLWNLCDVLRDDGINYSDYVTELVLLLFIKMEFENTKTGILKTTNCRKAAAGPISAAKAVWSF